MLKANADAMGIIFPNMYDDFVKELASERLMASIPFASRYRLIDFLLSSMVNFGIDDVTILPRKNYHSLMDHLGAGREWDLTRKNGGLTIFPPFAESSMKKFSNKIDALNSVLSFLKSQKKKYVIMSDCNIVMNFDFDDLLEKHIETNADVTVVYKHEPIPRGFLEARDLTEAIYYTFDLDGNRIKKILINPREYGDQNLSMNIYVIDRKCLINAIEQGRTENAQYFLQDIIAPHLEDLNIYAYEYTGYTARICDTQSYFDENMRLLEDENLEALFSGNQIYTKIRDDNPTRYIGDAQASNVMVADGCVIEGDVEDSVLFRGVKVGKGAKIKNCILMQDTIVEEGANLEYVVTDKSVTITKDNKLKGAKTKPFFVEKNKTV